MKVLLIEPHYLVGRQYEVYLQSRGHTVIWLQDAQSGIAAADTHSPDAVILELLIPGHSGIEFMYEFRSYADWKFIPVIVLSIVPKASMGISDKALADLGIERYLYKPDTSLGQLHQALERSASRLSARGLE